MARGQRRFRVDVPRSMDAVDKRIVGENIIRNIQQRTARHTDIDGNRFASYSADYRREKQSFGLGGSPNLYFTGEMMNSIQILEVRDDHLIIGLNPGSFEADKAYWNQGGNSNIPSREFLGETDSRIESVITQVTESSPIVEAIRFIERNTIRITDETSNRILIDELFPISQSELDDGNI